MTKIAQDQTLPEPPNVLGESVTLLGGSSGKTVVITKDEEDILVLRFPDSTAYVGFLRRDGQDAFTLKAQSPAGSISVVGSGISWKALIDQL